MKAVTLGSIITAFLLVFAPGESSAQDKFDGLWTGTITQEEGGESIPFRFELYLKQDGDRVTGRSYVFADGIYAEMELEGDIHSDFYLHFQELKIVDSEVHEGMEWCIKSGHLVLKRKGKTLRLEGAWRGKTSFSSCTPGKVLLEKEEDRA